MDRFAHGSKTMGVWKRTGRVRKERLQLMYVFARQVQLRPRFGFRETMRKVAMERFPVNLRAVLRKTLATAR